MAEKTLNTRIQLKYDTYTNWTTNNPALKSGELAIVVVPGETGAVANEPAILAKVGDGTSTFNQLSWISAPAADVYSWAKAAQKPTYNANEIADLDSYIQGKVQDTNTQYRLVKVNDYSYKLQKKDLADADYSDVAGSSFTIPEFDVSTLANSDAAVANQFVTAVKEANGIVTVERAAITEEALPTISQGKVDGLTAALAAKQDTVVWQNGNYDASTNKAVTKADLDAAVAGLSGAMHFEGTFDALPEANSYDSGDVVVVENKEYVLVVKEGVKSWEEFGNPSNYAIKGSIVNADIAEGAAIAQSKIAGLTEALDAKADEAVLANYVTKAEAPGYNDILTATTAAGTYETITNVKEVKNDVSELQAHALLDTDTFVFNCGDSDF